MTDEGHKHTHTHTHTHKLVRPRARPHTPQPVWGRDDVTVLWNQTVHTDRECTANRPDIIIKTKKGKTRILIDAAIRSDRNVQKEAERELKYMY
jgi:hypothetical protein